MVLFQLDSTRFIQIYIVQALVGVYFLLIAYKILKRDTKRLNLILSLFYIIGTIGIVLNCIYAPLTDETAVYILNFMTNYCFGLAPIFIVVFSLILLKSEKIITTKKQLLIIIIYGAILFCMILIPNGVTINESTNWRPVWSVPFLIYVLIVISALGLIPTVYFGYEIFKRFEDKELKNKWKFFVIGIIGVYVFTFGTFISNTLNIDSVRTIWSIISLGLNIVYPYFIYHGVGRQLKK